MSVLGVRFMSTLSARGLRKLWLRPLDAGPALGPMISAGGVGITPPNKLALLPTTGEVTTRCSFPLPSHDRLLEEFEAQNRYEQRQNAACDH